MIILSIFRHLITLFIFHHFIQIISSEKSCGSGNWTKFRDEKCILYIDRSVTQTEAKELCRAEDPRSGVELISIQSTEEQNFLNDYLMKFNVEDSVWIDLMRFDDKEFTFQNSDGDVSQFENWALNRPTGDPKKRCVQMRGPIELSDKSMRGQIVEFNDRTLESSDKMLSSGKWEDVVCYKKNRVLCQKYVELNHISVKKALFKTQTQLNFITKAFNEFRQRSEELFHRKLNDFEEEFHLFQEKTKYIESKLEVINNKTDISLRETAAAEFYIREFIDNPVPLGFVYVQLPGQPEPSILWPAVQWSNITDTYSGLFFRVFGNSSDPFSEIQEDSAPRLTAVVSQVKQKSGNRNFNEQLRPNDKWSKDLYTGSDGGDDNYYMSFKLSSGEVRPRNTAVYIWKRTK